MLCELSQVHGHLPGFQVGQLGGFLSLMAVMGNCSSESVVCPFHTMLGVLVLRVSCLCLRCLQDNTVTLGLVDTIDTVMGHISSNLQSREPHVTLTGSSSMAGSPSQIGGGGQWGLWKRECQACGPHWLSHCRRLTQQLRQTTISLRSSALWKNPAFGNKCVRRG